MASSSPHVIAEAGANHGGDLETAIRLIDIAKQAGADSVKFQILYPDALYLPRFYQNGEYQENPSYQNRKQVMLADDEYRQLAKEATAKAIPLSASVFDERSLRLLEEFDPPYIKIASCDLNNYPLIQRVAEAGRKVVLSTGMSQLGEIEQAVDTVTKAGNDDLVLMHCVSIYPCGFDQTQLNRIEVLKRAFACEVGFSDHTESSLAACIAVSMGVSWIEKHFTYDRSAPGFDHAYAMELEGLKQYIEDVRQAATAVTPRLHCPPEESQVRKVARRSLYAARKIAAGEVLSDADVLVVRPEGPLDPIDIDRVLGQRTKKDFQQYEPLCLEHLGPSS